MRLVLIVLAALLALPAEAGGAWRWPVRGEVLTPFALRADPFARGQHRGIDIAARAGAPVRAPCGGGVRFAGRLPGGGRGVSIVCGRLVATLTALGRAATARGRSVAAGAFVGTAGPSHVQLGARRLGDRHGYVDPRRLLAGEPVSVPPLAPPAGKPERGPPAAAPREVAAPEPRGVGAEAPEPRGIPPATWLGLALLGAATPLGALWRRRAAARRGLPDSLTEQWPSTSRPRSST